MIAPVPKSVPKRTTPLRLIPALDFFVLDEVADDPEDVGTLERGMEVGANVVAGLAFRHCWAAASAAVRDGGADGLIVAFPLK